MIERYADPEITKIWSSEYKLKLWQEVELAVIQARRNLGELDESTCSDIKTLLQTNPIDLEWWLRQEKEVGHDLNAFVDERLRFLPPHLQQYFHSNITSYDVEEPAFTKMLGLSLEKVKLLYIDLVKALEDKARQYRYVVMIARTHGQWAQLQSAGKRFLSWIQDIGMDEENIIAASERLNCSKLSGTIGNYGGIGPALEQESLRILGFMPFFGATQIMPREIYAPVAQALCQLVCTLDKIALTIRLGARSGYPIYQEPFGRKGKGSTAMPQKRNTIITEQRGGMADMAKSYLHMIMDTIRTWEERTIEQSCVERVAWPDLLHITIYSLKAMKRVIEGLLVYPDNMLLEIRESRRCYASSEAKEFLKREGAKFGLGAEDAYRIVQLAGFNAFEPSAAGLYVRENLPSSLTETDKFLSTFSQTVDPPDANIKDIIRSAQLRVSKELASTQTDVKKWNEILRQIFAVPEKQEEWNNVFLPSYWLKNEGKLYQEILGE